ncbi:Peptidase family M48 [Desulfonatronum thiosulfatophilum]|uniref:Peptidase family M48 n=1 Tax=Desulfonatronum thiosulfatophilum TaxID=617002 RepID=A0A1G6AB01_9BACT|nr:M48 family metallopeptidase [Desulfonatronum thiosulfatophilum]SDB05607.1 Peptidase family M48 [Desulfonatronum thiosulfatophilum]
MRELQIVMISLLFLLVAACATVPVTGRTQLQLVPSDQLAAMSQEQHTHFMAEHKLSGDVEKVRMVREVGQDIAWAVEAYMRELGRGDDVANYNWDFSLVEDDSVNAFAMPGGKVVIFTGILPIAQNRDGLAVIMGHEIAHVVADHGNERMSQGLLTQLGGLALATALSQRPAATQELFMAAFGAGAQVGVLLPFSRLHEREADHLGLIFMAMAGYNPEEAPRFWERMTAEKGGAQAPEFLSTHPADSRRIEEIRKLLPEAMEYYRASQ